MKALVWEDEELGAKWDVSRHPRRPRRRRPTSTASRAARRPSPDSTRPSSRSSSARRRSPPTTCGPPSATPPSPTSVVPILNGSAFKNKGVQPLLDAVVDYLPSPLDLPPTQGMNPKGDETLERKADDNEPFSALAFKIMTAPHVGKLTYFRVYSARSTRATQVHNTPHRQQGAPRPPARDARQRPARTSTSSSPATSSPASASRTPAPATRCATIERPDRARGARVPRARHPRRRRAEDQGRPGQDGQGPLLALRGGPDLPGPHRRGDRPDRHLRHGRAAPRGARRPHAARVQGRRHRRQAAGRLPRDHHQNGREAHLHPQEADRWLGPVRRGHDHHRDHRPRRRLRVRRQDHRRPHPQGVHPLGRRRHPGGA